MNPTMDFLNEAESLIRKTLENLRPQLLEAQGNIEHRLKEDDSVVTAMDTYVEQKLQEALSVFDGGIDFGGEETGVDYDNKSFWLVDPIDGTEPFIRGIPIATNMVTLIDNNIPVMGIIYNFSLGDYYLAIRGKGATCNGHPIKVSNRPIKKSWVALSTIASDPANYGLHDSLSHLVGAVRRFGSAGFDYSMLASGALDARVMYNGHGHEWDFAPTTLLALEAGARVANIGSDTYDYRILNHLVANPVIFDELMRFLNDFSHRGYTV